MKKYILLLLIFFNRSVIAQDAAMLTIEECYELATTNYPLVKQRALIHQSTEYTVNNISKGYLPQVSFAGQATYQSEVTQLPIKLPGNAIEPLSKDQYKIYGEVSQVLYDGGSISNSKKIQELAGKVEEQKLEVELYKLKDRINQLYFGILLLDEQKQQVSILLKDIEAGLKKVDAAVANGTALKSASDLLKAEWLKSNQRNVELMAARKAFTDMLSVFLNRNIDTTVKLKKPEPKTISASINRPELKLYDFQQQNFELQAKLIVSKNLPKLGLFVQGGYGRPALNFLRNDFRPYYIGGVRFSWTLGGLYTFRKDRKLIDIGKNLTEVQRETFLFNTNLTLKQQNTELDKLTELLRTDQEIIDLRTKIKQSMKAQLDNGVVTSSDYLREVNAEDQARQNLLLHNIQLLMAQCNYQITSGN